VSHLQSKSLIHYSAHTSCSQRSSSLTTVFDAEAAGADERLSSHTLRKEPNRLSGGGWLVFSEVLGSTPTSSVGLVTYQDK